MQFKNAFVGAVIGAAVGIGLLVATYFLFGTEHTAFAILIAILVGFGVRTCVATKGHVSYARGAMTALLAIAAFVGGKFIVAEIASRQVAKDIVKVAGTAAPPAERAADDSDAATVSSEDSAPAATQMERQIDVGPASGAVPRGPRGKTPFSTWDFLWLCAAALVAYELGRGTDTTESTPGVPPTPAPTA